MNYIVFDLEFNQGYKSKEDDKSSTNPQYPFEIIQIGAVKIDENFKLISTLDMLIKPELYTVIHPIVAKITGITIEDLDKAHNFKDVYKDLIDFIDNDDILVVWGMCDIKELFRNITYHKLDTEVITKSYINLQRLASKHFKCPKGVNIGLQSAVELLNLSCENQFHNAFNDAYYTSEVFKMIYDKGSVKPQIYTITETRNTNRTNVKKTTVDTAALINQFEKMFNREMTDDEKSIIKLAYIMGKTNQFQVSQPNNAEA